VSATRLAVSTRVAAVFSAGSIPTTGQLLCQDAVITAINGTLPSGGNGVYTYAWYKDGGTSAVGTSANYTPTDATGTHTYTRKVKDGQCNTTLTASSGSWKTTANTSCYYLSSCDFSIVSGQAGTANLSSASSTCSNRAPAGSWRLPYASEYVPAACRLQIQSTSITSEDRQYWTQGAGGTPTVIRFGVNSVSITTVSSVGDNYYVMCLLGSGLRN
jgi:hypothetical protein